MDTTTAISIEQLSHHYGDRCALDELSLSINAGEVFVFLGPNGGGKTTLFRVLSTLMPMQQGSVQLLGFDLAAAKQSIRQQIGVVFQSPSLDKKLTVRENILHQAALYGLSGKAAKLRADEMMGQLGIADRASDICEELSGGLRRRVELAKGMIHQPRLLLLDEPSTGLDPGARSSMWEYLQRIRKEQNVTIVLTTHLLEEAEKADRIAILNVGKLVALDTPSLLKQTVGGDTLTISGSDLNGLAEKIQNQFQITAQIVDETLRIETTTGATWVTKLTEAFPEEIDRISLGKPTLEDVFIAKTGHRFWNEGDSA
ncbi:MAG: ABC transporter ATP-binding protein [Blastopirellula sp.]|nr:MAG: ABC transporter ATP-binding protein [Blastopirellula sp.]